MVPPELAEQVLEAAVRVATQWREVVVETVGLAVAVATEEVAEAGARMLVPVALRGPEAPGAFPVNRVNPA